MANETNIGSLPVASEGYKGEIFAAFARIDAVPCSGTLIDLISGEIWDSADEQGIEAGSYAYVDEMDFVDDSQKKIA